MEFCVFCRRIININGKFTDRSVLLFCHKRIRGMISDVNLSLIFCFLWGGKEMFLLIKKQKNNLIDRNLKHKIVLPLKNKKKEIS